MKNVTSRREYIYLYIFFIHVAVHHWVDVGFQKKGKVIEGIENSTEFLSIIKKMGRYNLTKVEVLNNDSSATNIFESTC